MAKYYSKSNQRRYKKTNFKTREQKLVDFAYNVGLVERGLKNKDSKIFAAHERGLKVPAEKQKRTLF